jgi:hypothetical protein
MANKLSFEFQYSAKGGFTEGLISAAQNISPLQVSGVGLFTSHPQSHTLITWGLKLQLNTNSNTDHPVL